MATGEKLVNLDSLKTVHDKLSGDVTGIKSAKNFLADTSRVLIFESDEITGTKYKEFSLALPAGKYILNIADAESSDIDADYCTIRFSNNMDNILSINRGEPTEIEFELASDSQTMYIYASNGASTSTGDTFTVSGLTISKSVTDKTLSKSNMPADAEVTGGKFADLERYIPYTNYYNVKRTSWFQGTINKNTGIPENSNPRCRNGGYIFGADLFYDGKAIIKVKDGYRVNVFAYNKPDNTDGSYEGILFDALQSGLIIINENTEQHASRDFYYRIIIGKTDNSKLTPADIPEDAIITYGGKRELPTVATTQTGVERYITRFTIPVNIAPYGETKNVVDYRCVIQLPGTYKANGDPTPLIMIGHGGTGYVSDNGWNDSSNFRSMVDDFCGAGYAVFDVNNTIDDTTGTTVADEGCLTLMQAYIGAWEFIKKHYNISNKLYIVSNSMGTFAAMNMLKWYGSNVNTAVLCGPRVSIGEVYARMDTTNREHLAYVFGWGSTPAADQYATVKDLMYGWDNYLDIYTENNIKKINRHFPPIKVMVGANDPNGLTEVREYFPALNRSGNIVEYKEVSGADHGAICNLTPEGTRAEVIEWLNRFSGLN